MSQHNLHHYTNIEALMGIVKNECLWFSHIRFMNDDGELVRVFDHVTDLIACKYAEKTMKKHHRFRKSLPPQLNENELVDNFKKIIQDHTNDMNVFVGSFCKTNNDLLSQWRGYTGGTTGYCITFDEDEIKKSISLNPNYSGTLEDCIYNDNEVSPKIDVFKHLLVNDDPELSQRGWMESIKLSSVCKHEGFKEENEKRIILTIDYDDQKLINYRVSDGILIPYLNFKISKKSIKSIKIGPSKNQIIAGISLRKYLDSLDRSDIEIEYSGTPLRA